MIVTDFVTFEARSVRQAMRPILAVVERRNTIPILSCARITIDNDGAKIIGTDLDMQITATVDVLEAKGKFSICLDARKLAEIATANGVGRMKIAPLDGKAEISIDDDAASYIMPTLPVDDFPDMAGKRGVLIERFGNGSLAALMNKVKWCISTEDTRYYLNGVAWQFKRDGRRFVATDGHKLAACRYSGDAGDQPDRIIPRKLVGIIAQHLKSADVSIYASPASHPRIDILSPGLTIRAKLIDGTFPDWSRVVPGDNKYAISLQRGEIMAAIDQATAIGSQRVRAVRFAPNDGRMFVEHKSAEYGAARVRTSVSWPEGAPDFGFNHQYFRIVAANCDNEIEVRMTNSAAPFTFHDSDETMTRVLMPMRV